MALISGAACFVSGSGASRRAAARPRTTDGRLSTAATDGDSKCGFTTPLRSPETLLGGAIGKNDSPMTSGSRSNVSNAAWMETLLFVARENMLSCETSSIASADWPVDALSVDAAAVTTGTCCVTFTIPDGPASVPEPGADIAYTVELSVGADCSAVTTVVADVVTLAITGDGGGLALISL